MEEIEREKKWHISKYRKPLSQWIRRHVLHKSSMAVTQLVNKQGIYLFICTKKEEEDSSNSCFYQKQEFFLQVFPHFLGVPPRP